MTFFAPQLAPINERHTGLMQEEMPALVLIY